MSNGWTKKRIGDVCDLATGGTPSTKKPEYFGGDIKWLVSGDIHRGEIFDCEGRITEAGMKNSNARLLPVNSVLIALNGQGKTRGSVALLRTEATCNQSLVSISPKPSSRLSPEFLYAYLRSRYEDIRRLTSDDDKDRRGLNMTLVRDIEVPIAPPGDQRRIVSTLKNALQEIATAADLAERNLQSSQALFESYVEQLFERGGKSWLTSKLSHLCEVKHGFAFEGRYFRNQGTHVLLTPGNFYERGGYRDRGEKQKFYVGDIPPGFVLKKGDLLVAMTEQAAGLLGSPLLVPESNKYLHNQRLGLVVKKASAPWANEFFFHVFNTATVRHAIHASASGLKVRHTSPTKVGDVVVSYPSSVQEQKRIVAQLTELQSETKRLEGVYLRKVQALSDLRKTVLRSPFDSN